MAISQHVTTFAGRTVADFDPRVGIAGPADTAFRIAAHSYEQQNIMEQLSAFLADKAVTQTEALLLGCWSYEGEDSSGVVQALINGADKLRNLKHLFLGEIVYEEQEISWINQSDISGLFAAFPNLEELRVRGAQGLRIGTVRHDRLRILALESGGLPAAIIRQVYSCVFPALEHLEFWLGRDEYGGDSTVADLNPVLEGQLFPRLKYLGLRDSPLADRIAQAVVQAPVVRRLEVLDLSLGNLGNVGARALLQLPRDAKLKKLDIHHHYVDDDLVAQLQQLPFEVDAGDHQQGDGEEDEEERYIAHAE